MTDADPLVVFTPSGRRGRIPEGTSVLDAARMLGVDLDSVCGGRGICSRCQVTPAFGSFPKHGIEVDEGSISGWNSVEERYDRVRGLKPGRRLGCQARIKSDLVVDVPPESQVHRQVIRKSADTRPVVMDPSLQLCFIEVEPPDINNPSGDLERVLEALESQWQITDVAMEHEVLVTLQSRLRQGNWQATLAIHRSHLAANRRILNVWPGFYEGPLYGLAVDLGSTTIAANICSLLDGNVVASRGVMNPQIRFGEDLMSRVSYAMLNPGGGTEMTASVRSALGDLFKETAQSADVDMEAILEVVVVCNPVMHHLLLGLDPVELGQAPFALATASSVELSAGQLELAPLNPVTNVYVLPCIAGHVGADAAAVILSEEPQRSDDRVLIIDVGTNAEIVFGDKTRVLACSSPTGPAFEGAQISSGQRASPGAIEHVRIDPQTLEPRFKLVGSDLWSNEDGFNDAATGTGITGICGSGIIEVIAEMRLAGIVDVGGLIGSAADLNSARLVADGRTWSYVLHDGNQEGERPIRVTQNDVRAIQLAKSALYAGAKLLMDHFGSDHVDKVVLAGAFGSHISPLHAMVLGMIPDCRIEMVRSPGNSAGAGARIALCSLDARLRVERIVSGIEKIETAVEARFQEHFVNANAIPNAVDGFQILRRTVNLPDVSWNTRKSRNDGSSRRRRRR